MLQSLPHNASPLKRSQLSRCPFVWVFVRLCGELRGRAALHVAAKRGDTTLMQLLLERGCATSALNDTPKLLRLCMGGGSLATAEWLANRCGVDVATASSGATQGDFVIACERGQLDLVRFLARQGAADVNAPSRSGRTPLQAAYVHHGVVRLLLMHGAEAGGLVRDALVRYDRALLCAIVACGLEIGANDWTVFLESFSLMDMFLLMLMLDGVPRATAFHIPTFFVAAC